MIINSIIRSAGIVLIAIALAFALGTCGGGNQSSVPPSLKPGRASVSPQASDATGGQLQHRVEPRPGAADSLDDALVELAGMECPEGVDEELWGELKGALKEALSSRAKTIISGAGVSPANHLNHGRDARATDWGVSRADQPDSSSLPGD